MREEEVTVDGAYSHASNLISKLKQTGAIVLTDLDGTLTDGKTIPSDNELCDRSKVRKLLERKGVVAGAVTARTCALTLSSDSYQASESLQKHEWPPKWGHDSLSGKRFFVPLENERYFQDCLNFDFTGSFGGTIIVKNSNGYLVDRGYYELLQNDYTQDNPKGGFNREPWRHVLMSFMYDKLSDFRQYASELEQHNNYRKGASDSSPLLFRYQFNFTGSEGLEAMKALKLIIQEERHSGHEAAVRISAVDESKPDLVDPEKSRYTLYLVPWGARKERMVHRIFSQLAHAAEYPIKDTKLLYAGDTLTDLRTGLYAGGDAKLTFLLATGSRLAPYITEKRRTFGAENLSFLWGDDTVKGPNKLESRLVPTNEKGVYKFVHKARGKNANTIIVGDERYPHMTAPGSVHAFLQEYL